MRKNGNFTLPKGEIIWLSWYNKNNDDVSYIITSKPSREFYYLYKIDDGKLVKLSKGVSPLDLESKFITHNDKLVSKKRKSKKEN